jgi:hypothetical protein
MSEGLSRLRSSIGADAEIGNVVLGRLGAVVGFGP